MSLSYISVIGYGWSGASAAVDLLKEFENFGDIDTEFCMTWEPNGLLDLESMLFENWDALRQHAAISDFLTYCQIINSRGGTFTRWGTNNFSKKLGVDFMLETQKFIDDIIDFKYKSNKFLMDYKLPLFIQLLKRIRRKIEKAFGHLDTAHLDVFMARPSEEEFLAATRSYMDRLFINHAKNTNISYIILDQASPTANISKTMRYFNEINTIVVDRDPRDVYVNLIKRKMLIGIECSSGTLTSTEKFIRWYKLIRRQQPESETNKKILRLKFEDIVLDYQNTLNSIVSFLDIKEPHSQKGQFFDPKRALKNIGLWKNYKNQAEIDLISSSLAEFCYNK